MARSSSGLARTVCVCTYVNQYSRVSSPSWPLETWTCSKRIDVKASSLRLCGDNSYFCFLQYSGNIHKKLRRKVFSRFRKSISCGGEIHFYFHLPAITLWQVTRALFITSKKDQNNPKGAALNAGLAERGLEQLFAVFSSETSSPVFSVTVQQKLEGPSDRA